MNEPNEKPDLSEFTEEDRRYFESHARDIFVSISRSCVRYELSQRRNMLELYISHEFAHFGEGNTIKMKIVTPSLWLDSNDACKLANALHRFNAMAEGIKIYLEQKGYKVVFG